MVALSVDLYLGLGQLANTVLQNLFGHRYGKAMLVLSSLSLLPIGLGYLATATKSRQVHRLSFAINFLGLWRVLLVGATLYRACVNIRDYPLMNDEMRAPDGIRQSAVSFFATAHVWQTVDMRSRIRSLRFE